MVYELIRQGRLYLVGGGWSMSDEATTSYHAIIDHFTYSLRKINSTFLECGRPLVAWQTDVVGHSREFASLMAQMGYDGLFLAPIGYDEELSRLARNEMEFIWRGSDDLGVETDIFSHILFDGINPPPGFCFSSLCDDPLLVTSSDTFKNIDKRATAFIESMLHRQSPYYSTKNVMVAMGGRLAYFDAPMWFENIDKLIHHVNAISLAKNKGIYVFYSTPACYLKAVYDENPKLRTKQDDFHPQAIDRTSYATGGYTSRPSLKLLAREGHKYLQIAKQLHVSAKLYGYEAFFEDFNWINGVFQDHHVITGELWPQVLKFYVSRMDKMLQRTNTLIQDAFNKLRKSPITTKYYRCRFNTSDCINTSGPHVFVVVYNPLAWPVTIPVRLPIRGREYIIYSPQGPPVTAAIMPIPTFVRSLPGRNCSLEFELIFHAKDLPPMGFRSYYYQLKHLGWKRPERSLLKKINNPKPKKYISRQTSPDNEELIEPDRDYEDTINSTNTTSSTKILFGNISKIYYSNDYNDVLTPKSTIDTTDNILGIYTTTDETEYSTVDTKADEGFTKMDEMCTKVDEYGNIVLYNCTNESTASIASPTRSTPLMATTPPVVATSTDREALDDRQWRRYWRGYESFESSDLYIRSKYLRVKMDSSRRLKAISLSNGIEVAFDIQMVYYVSDDPARLGKTGVQAPGAYVFRSMDNKEERIEDSVDIKVYKNKLVQEIHFILSPYAGYTLKLYRNSTILEVDWVVGPIPVDDWLGKDVFIKYVTDLDNDGVFYTDSNGRQTIKRVRNKRATFDLLNEDPVAGNIYPVTSKIYIEDMKKNVRLSIFNDRSQGGTSLKDGEINLMVHRRLLTSDPIKENMNDTEYDKGVVVRGQHYLYISKADFKPSRVFEKKFAKEIELRPQVFVSSPTAYGRNTKNIWKDHKNEFSSLKQKLPIGIHVLTFEKLDGHTILLRLENFLEKSDTVLSGVKRVFLKDLFVDVKFGSVKEMTLAGNMELKEWTPLNWGKDKFYKSFNEAYTGDIKLSEDSVKALDEVDLENAVVLEPQQIRTFLLTFEYFKENN